jgi:hypothetical protein
MPLPCNNVSVTPIKVSQLVRYSNLDGGDILLTVESGSLLWSRRSTVNDLKVSMGKLTGSYSGSFTGSFKGKSSGSFSGSYWGRVISKNTKATGSFSGSNWGSLVSKNTKATGSFSGSYWGSLISKNAKVTGSFSSTNSKLSGSFSGSYWGRVISKNTKATGSFSGSNWGSLVSKNTKATGSFSGSYYGKVIGSKGSLITGSFRGIDNITNFKGTGKKVSFNGTSSYSVSGSYALTASCLIPLGSGGNPTAFAFASWTGTVGGITPLSKYNISSITRAGTQPIVASQNPGVYCDVLFTTPCIDANYTVLSYCSWNTPADISAGGTGGGTSVKFEGDLGTSVVSNRTANGFRVTVFTGWHAGTPGDGDDYYYNTAQFPDYNSFVVFR